MRIRLDIAYDGGGFAGWARQPQLRTVQGELERALGRVLGGQLQLVVAGRTDAGVHAQGQVAHLDLTPEQQHRLGAGEGDAFPLLARRANGALGKEGDVVIRSAVRAPEGFDARFSAVWRRYSYRIADDITGDDPLQRHRTTRLRGSLDLAAMDLAARSLIGLHDFAAYCKPRPEATTIRTLLDFIWERDADGVALAHLTADAFCHSMVRALVGACAAVGQGRLAPERLVELREARVRSSAFPVLAAHGLTLMEVGYPTDELLAARAHATRARRAL